MSLPDCPTELPEDLSALIHEFGSLWASSAIRPTPEKSVLEGWQKLLFEWVETPDLPLFVRKHRGDRGHELAHETGRVIVPTDNSAPHWAFTLACAGKVPSLSEIRTFLAKDSIPVAMIQKSIEKQAARYRCTLSKDYDVNKRGWKLGHIKPVGLNTRKSVTELPIELLKEQHIALLAPRNMFVIPLAWSGLAEVENVIQSIATSDA
jgi:hypothetical protein